VRETAWQPGNPEWSIGISERDRRLSFCRLPYSQEGFNMIAADFRALLNELRLINSRLDGQGLELSVLRTELDIQFKRIATLQAELDLRAARKRPVRRPSSSIGLAAHGNGHGDL
jgi:hypothetical protein